MSWVHAVCIRATRPGYCPNFHIPGGLVVCCPHQYRQATHTFVSNLSLWGPHFHGPGQCRGTQLSVRLQDLYPLFRAQLSPHLTWDVAPNWDSQLYKSKLKPCIHLMMLSNVGRMGETRRAVLMNPMCPSEIPPFKAYSLKNAVTPGNLGDVKETNLIPSCFILTPSCAILSFCYVFTSLSLFLQKPTTTSPASCPFLSHRWFYISSSSLFKNEQLSCIYGKCFASWTLYFFNK